MTEFLEPENPFTPTEPELLGYPCKGAEKDQVMSLLNSLSDEEHSLLLEWVTYGLEGVIISGEDLVVDFRARQKEGLISEVEQSAVVSALDSRIAWFNLLDSKEEIPLLAYIEPVDGIGEGDVSNLEWEVTQGGASDYAFHKMIEEALRGLENWKKWVLGETRMRLTAGGIGLGIVDRMYKATIEYSPERMKQREEEFIATFAKLMEKLGPAFRETRRIVESLGIDWDELMSSNS